MEQRRSVQPAAEGGQRRAEQYSGLAVLTLCLAIGLISLWVGTEPFLPMWLWGLLLVFCLGCGAYAVTSSPPGPLNIAAYIASVGGSWAILLTMPNNEMLIVLTVVIAAIGVNVLPMRGVLVVVGLNIVVVLISAAIRQADAVEALTIAVFYVAIHLAAVFSTYALMQEARLRAELEEKNVELTTASVLLEDSAKTSERLRISRELHDLIGHQLTVLNLELEAAKHREAEQVQKHIEQASGVAKELLADVRSTVGELRTSDPGQLQSDLERIAAAVPSMKIWVEGEDELGADEQQTEALLRAAQEIITNAVKHAEANELVLTVTGDGNEIRLKGVNDGYTPKVIQLGHGLRGLRERMELLGGELWILPSPQFTVEIRLPLAGPASRSKGSTLSQEVR